jgi:hypothetical protein
MSHAVDLLVEDDNTYRIVYADGSIVQSGSWECALEIFERDKAREPVPSETPMDLDEIPAPSETPMESAPSEPSKEPVVIPASPAAAPLRQLSDQELIGGTYHTMRAWLKGGDKHGTLGYKTCGIELSPSQTGLFYEGLHMALVDHFGKDTPIMMLDYWAEHLPLLKFVPFGADSRAVMGVTFPHLSSYEQAAVDSGRCERMFCIRYGRVDKNETSIPWKERGADHGPMFVAWNKTRLREHTARVYRTTQAWLGDSRKQRLSAIRHDFGDGGSWVLATCWGIGMALRDHLAAGTPVFVNTILDCSLYDSLSRMKFSSDSSCLYGVTTDRVSVTERTKLERGECKYLLEVAHNPDADADVRPLLESELKGGVLQPYMGRAFRAWAQDQGLKLVETPRPPAASSLLQDLTVGTYRTVREWFMEPRQGLCTLTYGAYRLPVQSDEATDACHRGVALAMEDILGKGAPLWVGYMPGMNVFRGFKKPTVSDPPFWGVAQGLVTMEELRSLDTGRLKVLLQLTFSHMTIPGKTLPWRPSEIKGGVCPTSSYMGPAFLQWVKEQGVDVMPALVEVEEEKPKNIDLYRQQVVERMHSRLMSFLPYHAPRPEHPETILADRCRCVVCLQIPWDKWMSCEANHMICVACQKKIQGCPMCAPGNKLIYKDQSMLRSVAAGMKLAWSLKCPHAGCDQEMPWTQMEAHLQVCSHKPFLCPMNQCCEYNCCGVTASVDVIMDHIVEKHSVYEISDSKIESKVLRPPSIPTVNRTYYLDRARRVIVSLSPWVVETRCPFKAAVMSFYALKPMSQSLVVDAKAPTLGFEMSTTLRALPVLLDVFMNRVDLLEKYQSMPSILIPWEEGTEMTVVSWSEDMADVD